MAEAHREGVPVKADITPKKTVGEAYLNYVELWRPAREAVEVAPLTAADIPF